MLLGILVLGVIVAAFAAGLVMAIQGRSPDYGVAALWGLLAFTLYLGWTGNVLFLA